MILLSSVAWADMEIKCDPALPAEMLPPTGAEDVPVDTVPVVVFDPGNWCSTAWAGALSVADDAVVTADWDPYDRNLLLELDPGADLAADTDHRITVSPGWGEVTETGFRTGSGRVTPMDGGPVLAEASARWEHEGPFWATYGALSVSGSVRPAATDQPSLVGILLDDTLVAATVVTSSEDAPLRATQGAEAPPDEACLRAMQRDLAGNVQESEATCIPIERSGCAVAQASPALGVLGLVASALRRRRRSQGISIRGSVEVR